MKLKDCIHGILVVTDSGRVGMIKGITNNRPSLCQSDRAGKDYAIPLVEWSDGETSSTHPCNIEKLK